MTNLDPNAPIPAPLSGTNGTAQSSTQVAAAHPLQTPVGIHTSPSSSASSGVNGDARFGVIQAQDRSISSFHVAIIVFVIGAIAWFYSGTLQVEGNRIGRIGHTLRGILLFPPDESKLIILALVAMAAAAFIQMRREQKQLDKEETALTALRATVLQNSGRIDSSLLTSSLRGQASDSVLVRAVQAVWQVRNLQTPDLEAISAAVFVLEARRTGLGKSVANRLLLLSLLGTVIGLAGVIGTLQSQIGAVAGGDADVLLPKLGETLTTMGTAFSSTAYGIILCVFIAAHASKVNERRSHHVAEVQYFAVCELAPRLLPISLPQAISQIEALVLQSESFVTESRTLLDETRVRNVIYLQDLDQKTRESARMTANVVAGIETTIRAAAKEVHDALADAGKYVVEGAKAQITVAKSLDKLLGESTTSLENAAADLKTGMQDLSGASVTVQSAYKGLNTVITDLKTSLEGQSQAISDAAQGRLSDAANAAAAQQAAMQKMSENALASGTAQQVAMKRVSDDITIALTNLTTQISDFVRRSEPKLPSEQEWSKLQRTLDRCAEASLSFASAIGQLEKDGLTSTASKTAPMGFAGVTSSEMQQLLNSVTRQVTDSIVAAPQPLREDLRIFSQDMRQAIQSIAQTSQQATQHRSELPSRAPISEPRQPSSYSSSNIPGVVENQTRSELPILPSIPAMQSPTGQESKKPNFWQSLFGKKG